MSNTTLTINRVRKLLRMATKRRVVVVGDVMLDHFLWGHVKRISPEAPVPVVDFENESFMPGGAANVARNLTDLGASVELFGLVGKDDGARKLRAVLKTDGVDAGGLTAINDRITTRKSRVIAHHQQVVRIDRETNASVNERVTRRLLAAVERELPGADAIVVGDYNKGVVTQELLDGLRALCQPRGIWLSLDPKPPHQLDLSGLSLITPNRQEVFELGEQGMLLCRRGAKPVVIPTVTQEVFDVSGAGDTVIASFTLAIAAGASPLEATIFSNHAAGVVVGKMGTATVTPKELTGSFA